MNKTLNAILILAIAAFMTACKLAVIVVEGGEVQSVASGICTEGAICIHQVGDTSYAETFTAIPNPGWVFKKWNSGNGFFCGDSTEPECVISAQIAEGNELIEYIIASDTTFYTMPIFVPSPPITDTVTFNGNVWAQADLFLNTSRDQVNAVCPSPERLCNGFLNGYDVNGWMWASIEDVSGLLSALGHPGLSYPPEGVYGEPSSDWAPAFFDLGFRHTFDSAGIAYIALTSKTDDSCSESPPACGVTAAIVDRADTAASDFVEFLSHPSRWSSDTWGVWLYKPESAGP